jgi:superoxide dismutase, Cu-Zn family
MVMRRSLLLTLVAVLALIPSVAHAGDAIRIHMLPGASAFPESIGADSRTGEFFTGSLIDGSMDRGSLTTLQGEQFLPAGTDGRTSVAGVKVDSQSRVWVANAFGGRVLVYSESGQLLHSFTLLGPGSPIINDLVFSHGFVYVTDSARPFLYRLSEAAADKPGATEVEPWLSVTPPVIYHTGEGPFGINLNGIVASPDGRTLLTNQTNTGILWRIDVGSGAITQVSTVGVDLVFGDGMLQLGDSLYIARNAANQLVKLRLNAGWTAASLEMGVSNELLAFPTAIIELHGALLVTNSQLDAGSAATLPFTVLELPKF